jgi:hypothetical protein
MSFDEGFPEFRVFFITHPWIMLPLLDSRLLYQLS